MSETPIPVGGPDYVASLGFEPLNGGPRVRCTACLAVYPREGSVMRSHRRHCSIAPHECVTPGVCDA